MAEVTDMEEEIRLLNDICKSTEMGIDGIQVVQKRCKNRALHQALQRQLEEYQTIFSEADQLLGRFGESPRQIPAAAKIASHLTMTTKGLRDPSASGIAGMMIQGNTMGMIQMTRQLRQHRGSGAEARRLASRLIATEEANIEQMRPFL